MASTPSLSEDLSLHEAKKMLLGLSDHGDGGDPDPSEYEEEVLEEQILEDDGYVEEEILFEGAEGEILEEVIEEEVEEFSEVVLEEGDDLLVEETAPNVSAVTADSDETTLNNKSTETVYEDAPSSPTPSAKVQATSLGTGEFARVPVDESMETDAGAVDTTVDTAASSEPVEETTAKETKSDAEPVMEAKEEDTPATEASSDDVSPPAVPVATATSLGTGEFATEQEAESKEESPPEEPTVEEEKESVEETPKEETESTPEPVETVAESTPVAEAPKEETAEVQETEPPAPEAAPQEAPVTEPTTEPETPAVEEQPPVVASSEENKTDEPQAESADSTPVEETVPVAKEEPKAEEQVTQDDTPAPETAPVELEAPTALEAEEETNEPQQEEAVEEKAEVAAPAVEAVEAPAEAPEPAEQGENNAEEEAAHDAMPVSEASVETPGSEDAQEVTPSADEPKVDEPVEEAPAACEEPKEDDNAGPEAEPPADEDESSKKQATVSPEQVPVVAPIPASTDEGAAMTDMSESNRSARSNRSGRSFGRGMMSKARGLFSVKDKDDSSAKAAAVGAALADKSETSKRSTKSQVAEVSSHKDALPDDSKDEVVDKVESPVPKAIPTHLDPDMEEMEAMMGDLSESNRPSDDVDAAIVAPIVTQTKSVPPAVAAVPSSSLQWVQNKVVAPVEKPAQTQADAVSKSPKAAKVHYIPMPESPSSPQKNATASGPSPGKSPYQHPMFGAVSRKPAAREEEFEKIVVPEITAYAAPDLEAASAKRAPTLDTSDRGIGKGGITSQSLMTGSMAGGEKQAPSGPASSTVLLLQADDRGAHLVVVPNPAQPPVKSESPHTSSGQEQNDKQEQVGCTHEDENESSEEESSEEESPEEPVEEEAVAGDGGSRSAVAPIEAPATIAAGAYSSPPTSSDNKDPGVAPYEVITSISQGDAKEDPPVDVEQPASEPYDEKPRTATDVETRKKRRRWTVGLLLLLVVIVVGGVVGGVLGSKSSDDSDDGSSSAQQAPAPTAEEASAPVSAPTEATAPVSVPVTPVAAPVASPVATPPVAPDDGTACELALPLTGDGSAVTGSLVGTTGEAGLSCLGSEVASERGLWYEYLGDGSPISAEFCFNQGESALIFEGADCSLLTCSDTSFDTEFAPEGRDCWTLLTASFDSVDGVMYHFYVYSSLDVVEGDFTLSLTKGEAPVVVSGDTCSEAAALGPVEGGIFLTTSGADPSVIGSTIGATYDDVPSCDGSTVTSPDVWYTAVGTGGRMIITLDAATTNFDAQVSVYRGLCGSLECTGVSGFGGRQEWESVAGEFYFVRVHGATEGASGRFSFFMDLGNAFCEEVANPLPVEGTVVRGTTVNAATPQVPDCDADVQNGSGVWFEVVGTGANLLASSVCDEVDLLDAAMTVYSGDCSSLQCMDQRNPEQAGNTGCSDTAWASELGIRYYVLLQGRNGQEGAYEVSVVETA